MFDKFEVLMSWKLSWGLSFLLFGVSDGHIFFDFSNYCPFTSWQARHQPTARSSLWQTYQVLRCQWWVRLMLLISCIHKSFKTNSQKRMKTQEIELFGQGDGVLWSSLAPLRWHPILQRLTNLLTQKAPCSFVVIMHYHFPSSSQDFFFNAYI